jgi:hypothetical protein
VHRLQRIPASGIYGDDFGHRTLWDEYCHEIKEGPFDMLEFAWDSTVNPIVDEIVNVVPRHEAMLLTIGARWELDQEERQEFGTTICPDDLREVLICNIRKLAGARRLQK